MNRVNYEDIGCLEWIIIAIFVGVLFLIAQADHNYRMSLPCSEHRNTEVRYLPARCLEEFRNEH